MFDTGQSELGAILFTNAFFSSAGPATTDANAFIDNGAGILATTTASSGGSSTLTFGGGLPAGTIVGTPVYNPADAGPPSSANSLMRGNYVTAIPDSTHIQVAYTPASIPSGTSIKFCVPSGTAGNVLTIHGVDATIGVGATVTGTGVPTGAAAPLIFDLIPFGYPNEFMDHVQYSLRLNDDITLPSSLNLGRRVFTIKHAVGVGHSAQTTLIQMNPMLGTTRGPNAPDIYKYGIQGLGSLGMIFLECPGNQLATNSFPLPNANLPAAVEGMQFDIVDGQKFGGGTALFGDQVEGTTTMPYLGPGAGQHIRIRFDGTVWRRCG
jgi:hypothetical protein